MTDFAWDQDDRYLSNDGDGPLVARILSTTDRTVRLERWCGDGPRIQFDLKISFFLSDRCGWRRRCR